jgi:LPXTG-motif cell wall-anchored protein
MRRLLWLLPLALVLALPPAAGAKEVGSLALCGTDGCHGVKGSQAKRDFENGAREAQPPAQAEPFLELRVRIRAHEGERIPGFSLRYLPTAGLLRSTDERGGAAWTRPAPALAAALRQAARGLRPKPAALLGSLRPAPPARARVDEVVVPAVDRDAGRAGGDGAPWLVLAGAAGALALGLAALRTLRRRRRSAARPAIG